MYTKVLTNYECRVVDAYITKNHKEFLQCVFDEALEKTMPSWRAEMLATDEAYIDYVVKLQQESTK